MVIEENILYFYTTPEKMWVDEKETSIFKRIFWKFLSDGKYIGEIKNGLPHGQGELFYVHGGKYDGGWNYGERNGVGSYTYSDGRKSFVKYNNGKKNGEMTITCPNGDTYEGFSKMGIHLESLILQMF